jgi:hypothetical protein
MFDVCTCDGFQGSTIELASTPRVMNRGAFSMGVSGYNTLNLIVDRSGWPVWSMSHTLHLKDLFKKL